MAESILYNVAAGIILNLGSEVVKEIGLWWHLQDDLEQLENTVSTIKGVLLDAEKKSMENSEVKNWLEKLSEAMYDADDLLDEFSTEAELHKQVMVSKKVGCFNSSRKRFSSGRIMAHKVKACIKRLDEIAKLQKFHLVVGSTEGSVLLPSETHSSPPKVVLGRQDDKKEIVERLLLLPSRADKENVSVISIVGIGGLGKTTLAQMAFHDEKLKNVFQLKMWIFVSVDFDVKSLVKKILESATGKPPQNTELDTLKKVLHKKINGKRYLLVLDGVWDKDEKKDKKKFSELIDLLARGARGSKIVVTTRSREITAMSRPIYIHELRGLSEDEAWSLFREMAFDSGQVPNQRHEVIGKEIVAKCRGVPSAIRAIGTMMYSKKESEWELFKNEELSKIDVYKEDILLMLKLSYNHLPYNYKHCFAYCSLYPQDFEIPVEELMRLWKAQGYLEKERLQDVFRNLYRLSFFQDVEEDEFGMIKSCKMHDLMHDLAVSVAGNNFSSSLGNIKDKTQHMSYWNSTSQDFSSLLKAKKTRTVLSLPQYGKVTIKEKELHDVFCNLRCLRVLSLSAFKFSKLPSSIYKLKHLRHLDLSGNPEIEKLPDSITNLWNLQVLKLSGCRSLKQLPNNITKLVNLTDLDNDGCEGLTHMPRGIGKLKHLEKLPVFVIAKDNPTSKNSGGLDELHALSNLRGYFEIRNLKYLKNAEAANLSEKKQLQNLTLRWNEYCSADDVGNDEMGLEALRPHQNLKRLKVFFYRGGRTPRWLPFLTNLVSVGFWDCENIQWLPPLDQLCHLKELSVRSLTKLEGIDVENRGSSSIFFPSLEELTLEKCPNLNGFGRCNKTSDVGSSLSMEELPCCFTRLSQLVIGACSNLTCMPLFPELKGLQLLKDGVKSLMKVVKMRTTSASASESTSSPFSTLSQLEHLQIREMEDCAEVDELVQYLPSLQKLRFWDCTCKCVSSDDKDDAMQWQSLKVLHSVEFSHMENLGCLPKGLLYVNNLQRLDIKCCHSLESIPEWMGNTALQHLSIHDCPQLSERCKNNTAVDWPKIYHIPNITIDMENI